MTEKNLIENEIDYETKLYQEKYLPFYQNLSEYMINYIIPDTIAFYLFSLNEHNCLGNSPLMNHLTSSLELFNVNVNIEELIPNIRKILLIKYHLEVVNENPLILKKSHYNSL